MAKGLHEGTDVKKYVLLDRPRTLNEFLAVAKIYIKHEGELYANNLNKLRRRSLMLNPPKSPSMR